MAHGYEGDTYFDLVAHHSTNKSDRRQLREVADFYRSLATQTAPEQPAIHRADYWRQRAEECRALVAQFHTPLCRQQLRRLADTYDYMAEAHEGPATPETGPPNHGVNAR